MFLAGEAARANIIPARVSDQAHRNREDRAPCDLSGSRADATIGVGALVRPGGLDLEGCTAFVRAG